MCVGKSFFLSMIYQCYRHFFFVAAMLVHLNVCQICVLNKFWRDKHLFLSCIWKLIQFRKKEEIYCITKHSDKSFISCVLIQYGETSIAYEVQSRRRRWWKKNEKQTFIEKPSTLWLGQNSLWECRTRTYVQTWIYYLSTSKMYLYQHSLCILFAAISLSLSLSLTRSNTIYWSECQIK